MLSFFLFPLFFLFNKGLRNECAFVSKFFYEEEKQEQHASVVAFVFSLSSAFLSFLRKQEAARSPSVDARAFFFGSSGFQESSMLSLSLYISLSLSVERERFVKSFLFLLRFSTFLLRRRTKREQYTLSVYARKRVFNDVSQHARDPRLFALSCP